jgi:hypothetical protein
MRGLVFRKYVWFNRTEAIKALEIGVWFVFGFLAKNPTSRVFLAPGYKIMRFGGRLQRTACG